MSDYDFLLNLKGHFVQYYVDDFSLETNQAHIIEVSKRSFYVSHPDKGSVEVPLSRLILVIQ